MNDSLNDFSWQRRFNWLSVFEDLELLSEGNWRHLTFNRHPAIIWCLSLDMRSFLAWSRKYSLYLLGLGYLDRLRLALFPYLRLHHMSHSRQTIFVMSIKLQVLVFAWGASFAWNFHYTQSNLLFALKPGFFGTRSEVYRWLGKFEPWKANFVDFRVCLLVHFMSVCEVVLVLAVGSV